MSLFGARARGFDKRYVECPSCGTADIRYAGWLGRSSPSWARYADHCRACGAHLEGDKTKDFASWQQWDALGTYYLMNGFAWAALWFFVLAIPISVAWDFPARGYAFFAALIAGAAFGLYRSRRAQSRGEMFEKKRKDGPVAVDAG
jgi:hypothetical protein